MNSSGVGGVAVWSCFLRVENTGIGVNPEAGSACHATHPKGSVVKGTLQEVTQSPASSSGSAGSYRVVTNVLIFMQGGLRDSRIHIETRPQEHITIACHW